MFSLQRALSVCLFSAVLLPAAAAHSATYYMAPSGSDAAAGSQSAPWKTLPFALGKLKAGDTLLLRGGTYGFSSEITLTQSGSSGSPITVKAYPGEKAIINPANSLRFHGASWWTIENLVFEGPGARFTVGKSPTTANPSPTLSSNIVFRGNELKNSNYYAGIQIQYGSNIQISGNYFYNIRSKTKGEDAHAILVNYRSSGITVDGNSFEDIGADGIQLGSDFMNGNVAISNVQIVNNKFWVNRPYKYSDSYGNVGENAIDIKQGDNIVIRGNRITGFHPNYSSQDVSGAPGEGITLHNLCGTNYLIERNYFEDNTQHFVAENNCDYVTVRNNIFMNSYPVTAAEYPGRSITNNAISFGGKRLYAYHNTFNHQNGVHFYILTGGIENQIVNNIFLKGTAAKIASDVSASSIKWAGHHNIWAGVSGTIPSQLAQSPTWSFSDSASVKLDSALRPLSGSPAIDAGAALGVSGDYGNATRDSKPDVGAYEYRAGSGSSSSSSSSSGGSSTSSSGSSSSSGGSGSGINVSASSYQDPNVPANTLDGNFSNRWSAEGYGQTITYDFGTLRSFSGVQIAWYQGNTRKASFSIQTSTDGSSWTTAYTGTSSGTTASLENYPFTTRTARYVRIVGNGNTYNDWNSISEVAFQTVGGGTGDVITVEAEAYTGKATSGTHAWQSASPGMQALPVNGTNLQSAISGAPRLDYVVTLPNAGEYYLWLRINTQNSGSHNSLNVGVNGTLATTANFTEASGWTWERKTISVGKAGQNTINLWMREDGLSIDKFVLTQSASYKPL